MRFRLAQARCRVLANDLKIMLPDEPFGARDNQTRALMQETLLRIWEREKRRCCSLPTTSRKRSSSPLAWWWFRRPGRIKVEVNIDLPHPRHYTLKTSPEFSALKARLTEEIRAEAVLAEPNRWG
jgi:NitT/TauT family transport system ATP-binding protein/sulfonate transport system ATP-binding protein